MAAVRDHLEHFPSDTDIVVVTPSKRVNIAPYIDRHEPAFPILSDPELLAYRAFGIGRGTVRRVWGWRMARRYLEIFRDQGFEIPKKATEDTLQLGGNFVINPDGVLTYGYWGEGPDDRPPVQALIDAIDNDRR